MKKIVCAIMCCVTLATFCSCQCKHIWEDATCTKPSSCRECGETQGTALGHSWSNATCTQPSTCRNCGQTQGTALGHSVGIGICSKCNQYSYALKKEAIELDELITDCALGMEEWGEHLVEYLVYSSDTYKRLAVAEAFGVFSVDVLNSFMELGKTADAYSPNTSSEFYPVALKTVEALEIIEDVLVFYQNGFTSVSLWQKMYESFQKMVPIIDDINAMSEEWNLP